jgi:glycosyltransferase involved in cell wall biosynthesis
MDTAIVTTRMIGLDAISNFTMASAAALKKHGKVSLYTFAYERPPVEGIDVRLLGGKNSHSMGTNLRVLLGTFGLARELAGHDVLVIVNPDVGSIPAYHLARRFNPKLKIIWTFHGLTPTAFVSGFRDRLLMRVRKWAYVRSMIRSDRVQVFSDFIKSELAQWGIDGTKVVVMPLGVEVKKISAGDGRRVRDMYGVGDRFLLLYVGRLVEFKHVDELIRAAVGLDGVCLVVAGDGPDRGRLEALSESLNAGGRVWLAGKVPDTELPDYYSACDAWATASRHEGFCVPIVEAMAAGKPVIIPDVAAMPETAGEAGLKYSPGDLEGVADAIRRLKDDKKLYGELSKNALARSRQFDMAAVLERYAGMLAR